MRDAPRDIYELLDRVRTWPAMWLGEASLTRLDHFIRGYQIALTERAISFSGEIPPFKHFGDWVGCQYGLDYRSSAGWCTLILRECDNESAAFSEFFRLLDMFRLRKPKRIAVIDLQPNHVQSLGIKRYLESRDTQSPAPIRIEIVKYPPDGAVYPTTYYEIPQDATAPYQSHTVEGFHHNLEEAITYFQRVYGIEPDDWEYES